MLARVTRFRTVSAVWSACNPVPLHTNTTQTIPDLPSFPLDCRLSLATLFALAKRSKLLCWFLTLHKPNTNNESHKNADRFFSSSNLYKRDLLGYLLVYFLTIHRTFLDSSSHFEQQFVTISNASFKYEFKFVSTHRAVLGLVSAEFPPSSWVWVINSNVTEIIETIYDRECIHSDLNKQVFNG